MVNKHRDLILAAEISGMLHDLGKLRPEFAAEGMKGGKNLTDDVKKHGFSAAHGAILEVETRAYPEKTSKYDWLSDIKNHADWSAVMSLPDEWVKNGTVQAFGLGDALRQHHANNQFSKEEETLLGDIYALGADVRDSALDKGSGGAKSGKQNLGKGFIANSFGEEYQQKPYAPEELEKSWGNIAAKLPEILFKNDAWLQVAETRKKLVSEEEGIQAIFRNALGETRRPTNDVTLWHHSFSTASLFKAAVAEGVLRQDFKHLQQDDGIFNIGQSGRIRFRLLGIRWNWAELTQGALKPVLFSSLTARRENIVEQLRQQIEIDEPIGNLIYDDDNGVIFAVPAFYEGETQEAKNQSEALFKQHIVERYKQKIDDIVAKEFGVGISVRLAWTNPALYLTDYPQVISPELTGENEELLQAGFAQLQEDWQLKLKQAQSKLVQICSQCGLRPAESKELEVYDSGLDDDDTKLPQGWCDTCVKLSQETDARRLQARKFYFGFQPETFNLQKIRKQRNTNGNNARVVLISVQVDSKSIASGEAFVTQLARPVKDIKVLDDQQKENYGEFILTNGQASDFLKEIIDKLRSNISNGQLEKFMDEYLKFDAEKDSFEIRRRVLLEKVLGDSYWTTKKDGRSVINGSAAEKAIEIAENFFFKEAIPEGLCRHEGDKLLLFGMRKHPSPARLARTWDDLRELWLDLLSTIGVETNSYAMPISLDANGFRIIVAAEDARRVLLNIQDTLQKRLSKVRAGIVPQISALIFRDKFPLYVAMDALKRMEQRPQIKQTWKVVSQQTHSKQVMLHWQTPQGEVTWNVDTSTGDFAVPDIWYPHVICTSRPEGLERLVHVKDLKAGDEVLIPVANFDFAVLDGTVRRYELRYDPNTQERSHFVLGTKGYKPYLLEHMVKLLTDFPEKIASWNPSQSKAILGQLIECYEKWVRDVPEALQETGKKSWLLHAQAIFAKTGVDEHDTALFLKNLENGLFFDAFEWATFIEK